MSTVPFLFREVIELKAQDVLEYFSHSTLTKPQLSPISNICKTLKEKQKQSEQELKLFQNLMQRTFKGELVSQ